MIVNVPSAFTFAPEKPNDDDMFGPANSCDRLIDSPASGAPDDDIAVPLIVATRPGTMLKSTPDTSRPSVTFTACAFATTSVPLKYVGPKPTRSFSLPSAVHVSRVVPMT